MAYGIDTANKRIILDSTNATAQSIYAFWVDWVATGDNFKYLPAFRATGGDDLGGGISIPAYYFLINGWRVRPMEQNHTLTVTGNLFVDGGGDPIVPTLGTFNVLVKNVVPVQAQAVSTSGGSGATLSEIEGSAILAKEATVLSRASQASVDAISLGGLSENQATMILEMYELLGLDPTKPLIVTDTFRSAGDITQTISTSATETIVSRSP